MLRASALVAAVVAASAVNASTRHSAVWDPSELVVASSPRTPLTVVFRDFQECHFAGTVSVGTPSQPVVLLASLYMSDFVVLNHKFEQRAYYNHDYSSTYHANGTRVELVVGRGEAIKGFSSRDRIILEGSRTLDGANGRIAVHDQLIMELDGPDELVAELLPKVGGVIGFAPSRASSTGAPSIVRSMISQGRLGKPIVGLRYDNASMHATFGGVDAAYCDETAVAYFEQDASTEGGFWTVPLAAIDVNGSRVVSPNTRAIVVGYFDRIVGPDDEIDKLADEVGTDSTNRLPCDGDGPDLQLRLGNAGDIITLTKKQYTRPPSEDGTCFFALAGYSFGPIDPPTEGKPWVFGLGLLHTVYTVLDFGASDHDQRIGFAKLKQV